MRGWALFFFCLETEIEVTSDWATPHLVWLEFSKSGNHLSWSQTFKLCRYHSVVVHLAWRNRTCFHFTGTGTWGVFTSGTRTQVWARLDISLVSVNTIRVKITRRPVRQFDPCGARLDNVVGSSFYLYLRMRFERDSAQTKRACRPIKRCLCLFSPESVASQKQEPLWFSELSR